MTKHLSPQKRHRQSLRRRERNRARRTEARSAIRHARESLAAGQAGDAESAVRAAAAILDRTAGKRVIHPNTAGRTKSRLTRQLNALKSGDK